MTISVSNCSDCSKSLKIDYLTAFTSSINLIIELAVLAVDSLKIIIIKNNFIQSGFGRFFILYRMYLCCEVHRCTRTAACMNLGMSREDTTA